MRTEHFYIPSWERFAGKPYVKPGKNTGLRTRKTGVIAGTVKDAQKLLCQMEASRLLKIIMENFDKMDKRGEYIAFLCGAREDYVWPGQKQSLGELCIELEVEAMCDVANNYSLDPGFFAGTIKDIQNLRTLMYYKRKNHFVGDSVYDNTEYLQAWVDGLNNAGGTTVTTNCYMFAGYPY